MKSLHRWGELAGQRQTAFQEGGGKREKSRNTWLLREGWGPGLNFGTSEGLG